MRGNNTLVSFRGLESTGIKNKNLIIALEQIIALNKVKVESEMLQRWLLLNQFFHSSQPHEDIYSQIKQRFMAQYEDLIEVGIDISK